MVVEFTPEFVADHVKKSPKNAGSWNVFVKMNDKIGLKLTPQESTRDGNYTRQTKAAEIGLGPDTYGKINITVNDILLYGYFTEIVEMFSSANDVDTVERRDLYDRLIRETGFYFEDCHYDNLGMKNGKMVCIDFDVLSNNEDEYDTKHYLEEIC